MNCANEEATQRSAAERERVRYYTSEVAKQPIPVLNSKHETSRISEFFRRGRMLNKRNQ